MNTQTLPELNDTRQLPADIVNEFREKGHTLVRGVLSTEEVEAFRPVITNAAEKYNTEKRSMEERDTYGKAFLQIMNLWRVDEDTKKYVFAKRFAKIAADLLGVENVRLYHDQALYKEPGGGPTPWHQDQYYWPIDSHDTVTMWMPLVDIDVDMGMLTFASNSFDKGAIFDNEISDASETAFDDYVKQHGFNITCAETMKAGDATFHRGFTIHKAPGNNSDTMREVMTVIYIADGAKITEPKNKYQVDDHRKWLDGKPVGGFVDSELNPKLL
ncbi:phytanoyl-CoA dioxygenase family protein [Mucilaginibacter limnophilus]|uniref:Phytanoyl-CoA dioxygenase family protein n=1 Tax=Mucilaginibacter limnophilus TaxID=1932778 RepID=A0A437MKD1_9SPHI|nr:phytanoyl-CoA dioxygenase family protein [Mucilaginibacter limnophilus]RVT98124.1 phytanoyl-CoA dioxygenase family protein [Mucilaginibacter limnophilus]